MFNITNDRENANQNYIKVLLHICQVTIKKKRQLSVGENIENWNPCTLFMGMLNGATPMKNSMEFPQKIKDRTTI